MTTSRGLSVEFWEENTCLITFSIFRHASSHMNLCCVTNIKHAFGIIANASSFWCNSRSAQVVQIWRIRIRIKNVRGSFVAHLKVLDVLIKNM